MPCASRIRIQSLLGNQIPKLWPVPSDIKKKDTTPLIRRNNRSSIRILQILKEKVKKYHDQRLMRIKFRPREMVLLFNSIIKLFLGKLRSKCFEPFKIKEIKLYGAVKLEDQVLETNWTINNQILKSHLGGEVHKSTKVIPLYDP